jgi:hypothetical protein
MGPKISYLIVTIALLLAVQVTCIASPAKYSNNTTSLTRKKKILAIPAFHPSHIKNMIDITSSIAADD